MKILFSQEIKNSKSITSKEILEIILAHRNIKDIDSFLHPKDPTLTTLQELDNEKKEYATKWSKTIQLLTQIKEKKQTIVVYCDYDADGITGGSILWETLHHLGFHVMPYVPNRKTEGYGFSQKGIDNVKKQFNPALIISVDHGITAHEKVTYAKSIGIPIIITDHHLKPDKLPDDAVALFHIPTLSGSGVSYYFAKEIFNHFSQFSTPGVDIAFSTSAVEEERGDGKTAEVYFRDGISKLEHHFHNDYLFLASIGTIADLVPLVGPSRSVVAYGLKAALKTKRTGLIHLFKEAGIEGKAITPYHVGFIIAPRINAIGRLKHALDALRLLCTVDDKRAQELAGSMGNVNKERQDLVTAGFEEAMQMIEKKYQSDEKKLKNENLRISTVDKDNVQYKDLNDLDNSSNFRLKLPKMIILSSDHWNEGIIGLIASRITEKYYRPTIVMTKADGTYKGSARSIKSLHLTNFLRDLKEYLVDVGGHVGAAGFTIQKEKMDDFIKVAREKAEKEIQESDLERVIEVDLKIPLSFATLKLIHALNTLMPFGIGNPQPTFYSEVELVDAKIIGKTGTHLKLLVKDPNINSFPLEMMAFGEGKRFKEFSRGMKFNVIYKLDVNKWNGKEKVNGVIQELLI